MTDLQREILKVYEEFKRVCDAHGLRYYATGGTKIGAVLWQGFVPWDDDIDLVMPQSDLEKFMTKARRDLKDNYFVFDSIHGKHGDIIGIKLSNKNSMFTSNNLVGYPESFTGVFIDIFPMIGAPSEETSRADFIAEVTRLKDAMYLKKLFDLGDVSTKQLIRQYDNFARKFPFDKAEYVFNPSNMHKEAYKKQDLIDATELKFQDTTIPIPKDFDAQLKQQYGSYTKDWPKEKRISTHKDFAFFDGKKSFTEYQKQIEESPINSYINHLIKCKINIEQDVIRTVDDKKALEKQLADMSTQQLELGQKIEQTQKELARINQEYSAVINSRTWRWTEPIRQLRRNLKG